MKILSIIIPVYNEEATLQEILNRIEQVELSNIIKEVILINDGSTDQTSKILEKYKNKYTVIQFPTNQGKGSAVKEGVLHSTGDIVLIQDADLEYDPQEYRNLITPIIMHQAHGVNGSRYISKSNYSTKYILNEIINKMFTKLSNTLTGYQLTDLTSCYKIMEGNTAREIAKQCKSRRFEIEAEIIARLAKMKKTIVEVPISYQGRHRSEGKHINYLDAIHIGAAIIRYNNPWSNH